MLRNQGSARNGLETRAPINAGLSMPAGLSAPGVSAQIGAVFPINDSDALARGTDKDGVTTMTTTASTRYRAAKPSRPGRSCAWSGIR
ncbi:hypothetical protein GCM10022255_107970 [Dactylosporangium darangshiense]|uniref:Uncharacterized protein n=1 Tax=Dactylosporangium darangshiense TaxID=579108 RepID=A0ABP8DU11_9ACTN